MMSTGRGLQLHADDMLSQDQHACKFINSLTSKRYQCCSCTKNDNQKHSENIFCIINQLVVYIFVQMYGTHAHYNLSFLTHCLLNKAGSIMYHGSIHVRKSNR